MRQRLLLRGGTNLCFLRTGADVSPLQGRVLLRYAQIFRGQITALIIFQGMNKRGLRLYCGFADICLLLSSVICLRIYVDSVMPGDRFRRLSEEMRPEMARTGAWITPGTENAGTEPAPQAPKGAGERKELSGCC